MSADDKHWVVKDRVPLHEAFRTILVRSCRSGEQPLCSRRTRRIAMEVLVYVLESLPGGYET